jgi:hypothetical protein
MKIEDHGNTLIIAFQPGRDDAVAEQARVLLEALAIYEQRNRKYNDNWKRMGVRGMLIRVRERAERLWDEFWVADGGADESEVDDAVDLINFAAFLVRALRGETTHGGSWWT